MDCNRKFKAIQNYFEELSVKPEQEKQRRAVLKISLVEKEELKAQEELPEAVEEEDAPRYRADLLGRHVDHPREEVEKETEACGGAVPAEEVLKVKEEEEALRQVVDHDLLPQESCPEMQRDGASHVEDLHMYRADLLVVEHPQDQLELDEETWSVEENKLHLKGELETPQQRGAGFLLLKEHITVHREEPKKAGASWGVDHYLQAEAENDAPQDMLEPLEILEEEEEVTILHQLSGSEEPPKHHLYRRHSLNLCLRMEETPASQPDVSNPHRKCEAKQEEEQEEPHLPDPKPSKSRMSSLFKRLKNPKKPKSSKVPAPNN